MKSYTVRDRKKTPIHTTALSDIVPVPKHKEKEQNSSGRRWQSKAGGRNSSQTLSSLFQREQQHEGQTGFLHVKQGKKTLVTTKASNRRLNTIETNKLLPRELSSMKTILKPLCCKTGHLISYAQVRKKNKRWIDFILIYFDLWTWWKSH